MGFQNDPTAGSTLIEGSIHSPNYATGSAGWTINKDGSAEFQNVLVRGTITASQIIGSTIIGGTITGGIFKSSNFDNTAHTGFEINATAAPDATATPPVPANTAQWYNTFMVGPASANHVNLAYNGTAAGVVFSTGNVADSVPAQIASTTFVQGGSGRTISELVTQSATENGAVVQTMFPSGGSTAADFPGSYILATSGETSPTGYDGVTGRAFLGGAAADKWQLIIENPNSAVDAGPVIGHPGLIIGDFYTPGSRLLVSNAELLSITNTGATETLFLNENSGETVGGSIANANMRTQGAFSGAGAAVNVTSLVYAALPAPQATSVVGYRCPFSNELTISFAANLGALAATVAGDFVELCVTVTNTTQATTPFAASDTRAAVWFATVAGANGGSPTLSRTITVTGLGNPGDLLTISMQARCGVANRYNISRTDLVVTASL